jgi:hypothetical protein
MKRAITSALTRAAAALRAFARGFTGMQAPLPRDAHGAREHLCRKGGPNRTPCC